MQVHQLPQAAPVLVLARELGMQNHAPYACMA